MRSLKLVLIPVCLTLLLVFVLFAPIMQTPYGNYHGCGSQACVNVVQYESISYAYGGWGALFQTGVNWYAVDGWRCSCPSNAKDCCVPPYEGVFWGAVAALFLADLLSVIFIGRRLISIPTVPATGGESSGEVPVSVYLVWGVRSGWATSTSCAMASPQ